MVLNKKGLIFTFLGILLSGLFVLIYATQVEPQIDEKNDLIKLRIDRLNNLVFDVEDYLGNTIDIATAYAIDSLITGQYENPGTLNSANLQQWFSDCLQEEETYCPKTEPQDKRTNQLITEIENTINNELGITTNIQITNIRISQTLPFNLEVTADLTTYIEDTGYATITNTKTIQRSVSIAGLKDPYYAHKNNLGFNLNATIEIDPILIDRNWTTTKLEEFINDSEYRYNKNGKKLPTKTSRKLRRRST